MGLEIRIDTNEAAAAIADLRKNITALGGDTKLSAAEIQKLEERLRKQMGADAAADALRKLQQQTGMTDAEMAKLRKQLGDTEKPKGFADAVGDLTGSFEKLAKTILGITAGLAALSMLKDAFAEAKTEYAKFQTAVIDIQKVTPDSFQKITATLQQIPPTLASASDAARAYYQALSAGFPGIEVTTAALKASNAAHTDAATSMNAITKVMNVYKMSSEEASKATSMLYGIEAAGVTTFGQLAPVIGDVATKAKQAGIDMEAMGGIMATVVKTTGSTNIAATSVGALFIDLGKQWKDLDGNLKGVFKNLSDQTGKIINNFEDFKNSMSGIDEKTGKPMDKTIQALKTLDTEAQKSGKRLDSMFSDQTAKLAAQKIQKSFEETAAAVEQVGSAVNKNLSDKAYDNWAKSIEGKAELVKNAQSQVNKIIGEEFTRAIGESTSAIKINGVAVGSWSAITNKAWMMLAEHPEVIRGVMRAMQDLTYVVILAGAPATFNGIISGFNALRASVQPVVTAVTSSFTTGMFAMSASAMSSAQMVGAAGILVGTALASWQIGTHIREWIESFDAGKIGLQSFADNTIGAFIILKGALQVTWAEITTSLTSGIDSAMANVSAIINQIIAKAQAAVGTVLSVAATATSAVGMDEISSKIAAASDKMKGLADASLAAANADKERSKAAADAGKEKIAAITSAAKAEYEAHIVQAAQNQAAIKTEFELRDRKKEIAKETADFKKEYGFEAAEAEKDIAEQEVAIAEDAADQIGQINQRKVEEDFKWEKLKMNIKKQGVVDKARLEFEEYEKSAEWKEKSKKLDGEKAQELLEAKRNGIIQRLRMEEMADAKDEKRVTAAAAREEKLIEKQMAKREDLENKWQADIANIREDEGDKFEKMLNREIEVAKRAGADLVMLEDWIAAQREQRRKASEEKIAEDIKNIREAESSKFTQSLIGSTANPKGDNVAAFQKAGVEKVKIDEWVSAQIFKNQEDLNKKLESEYESINGTKLQKQLLAIDKEYEQTVKAQNAILALLESRNMQETDEYQKVLANKKLANDVYLAKKAQAEQEALKKSLDFEIEYQKLVSPNNQEGINALEAQKREIEIREKYKGQDPVKVQQMIEADKADVARKEQEKLTADIQGMWKNMMSGISADATGAFALTGANISKMAGNLLDMAKTQGKGNAAAGFSQLFSGQVKSGDPLSGLSALGSQLSSGYKTLVESGTSIGNLVGDIDVGIKSFFGSASEGILSGVPWGSIASGALSLLSGGFSAENIGSTIGSVAGSFLGPIGTVVGGYLGSMVGGLFADNAGWGFGMQEKKVGWGQTDVWKKGDTFELERSSGQGDEVSKLSGEIGKRVTESLKQTYSEVDSFIKSLPDDIGKKANDALSQITFDIGGKATAISQGSDLNMSVDVIAAYAKAAASNAALPAINEAMNQFASGAETSAIRAGSAIDDMLQRMRAGFSFDFSQIGPNGENAKEIYAAEDARFQEFLALQQKFQAVMQLGNDLIANINAQLEPKTEYEQSMAKTNDSLESAYKQLAEIGYSETRINEIRASGAKLLVQEEEKWAKKRADQLADARKAYDLDGLNEYQARFADINNDFAKREEDLRQAGASEEKYQSDLIELSNIKAEALQKEAEAYRKQREAIYAELDKLAGFTPDFGAFEAGIEDLNAKLIAYRDQLIANGATPEEVQSATDKYVPAIQNKYQSDILSNSAKLAGRETEQTDYAAGAAKINAEFADMWKALQKSNGSVEQFVQLQEDYYVAMRNNAKAAQDTIDGVRDMAVEMAYGKKSVDLVTSATNTVNDKFAELSKTALKAGGDITALDALKSDAITRAIKESMFGDITAQTVANVLSSGVKTAVDNAANGVSTDFSALGKKLVTNINDTIRSDVANIEIGKTAELIYKNITDPILTGLAEKAKANGGIVSNEDIAKAMFPEDDPIAAKVMAYQAERTAIMQKATQFGNAETLTAELNALDARNTEAVQWLKDAASKPIELDEPKYELPEYDNTVDIAAPVYEMPEYSSVIKISAPTFEVSSTSVVSTSDRHSYAGGLIGVPEKEQHALIHEGELVITAPDAPKVWAYMQSQGMGRNYAKGKVPATPSGALPKFENGLGAIGNFSFDSTAPGTSVLSGLVSAFQEIQASQAAASQAAYNERIAAIERMDRQKAIERLGVAGFDASQFTQLKEMFEKLGGKFDQPKWVKGEIVGTSKEQMQQYVASKIDQETNKVRKERVDAESKDMGDRIYDAIISGGDIKNAWSTDSGGLARVNWEAVGGNPQTTVKAYKDVQAVIQGTTISPQEKIKAEIEAAKKQAEEMMKPIRDTMLDTIGSTYTDRRFQKGDKYFDKLEADAKALQEALVKRVQDKYAAEQKAAEDNLSNYLKGLAGEKAAINELEAAHTEAEVKVNEYAQKVLDAGGAVDVAAKQTEAYAAIEADFARQRQDIYSSASERLAELRGEEANTVDKAVKEETARWDEWYNAAKAKGASDQELIDLQTQEAEAVELVRKATQDKIDADKASAESEKQKAIEASKSKLTDQSSGLLGNIDDFMFGLNGKNKFEEKLKSWQGKTISTEDDLNAFVSDQINMYQDKFDKLADTYQGWSDVKESASEALSAFDIEPIAESISEVPKRLDDSLTSVTDYISDMQKWAENAKQLRSDFVNLQSSIAESRARISADLGTAGMSKLDTLNSKIGSGMVSLQALTPEDGLKKAQELRDLVMERYDEEKSQLESVTDSISKMKDMAETLRKKSDDLKYSDFNLTKGVARQDMMTQDYQSLLAKAKTGDASAVSDYTGFIDKYLQQSQQMYASSGQYMAIYSQVQSDLASLGAGITNQIPAQEAYLQSLNTVASETNVLLDQLSDYTEQQILSIDEGLSENKNAMELLLGDSSPIVMGQQQTVNAIGELKTVVNQNSQDNSAIMQALLAILNKDGTVSVNIDGDNLVNIVVSKVNKAKENGLQLLNV